MSVRFTFRGVNRVANKFRRLAALMPNVIEPTMRKWAQATRRKLAGKKYPPKRSGQRYRRTGRLGRSWSARKTGRGEYTIGNSAAYAGFVVGERQAWMHVGRWWKASEVIKDEPPKLVVALTEAIRDEIDG